MKTTDIGDETLLKYGKTIFPDDHKRRSEIITKLTLKTEEEGKEANNTSDENRNPKSPIGLNSSSKSYFK